jgi:hypothetical protein
MERFAETGAAIRNRRYFYRIGHVAGGTNLLVHGQQRLRGTPGASRNETTDIDRFETSLLDEAAAERIIGARHVDKLLFFE